MLLRWGVPAAIAAALSIAVIRWGGLLSTAPGAVHTPQGNASHPEVAVTRTPSAPHKVLPLSLSFTLAPGAVRSRGGIRLTLTLKAGSRSSRPASPGSPPSFHLLRKTPESRRTGYLELRTVATTSNYRTCNFPIAWRLHPGIVLRNGRLRTQHLRRIHFPGPKLRFLCKLSLFWTYLSEDRRVANVPAAPNCSESEEIHVYETF